MANAIYFPKFDHTGMPNEITCEGCGEKGYFVESYVVLVDVGGGLQDGVEYCAKCFAKRYRIKEQAHA